MKLRNKHSFRLMLGLGIGILFIFSACQSAAAISTVLPTAINQHVTTQPPTTTAIVTQVPSATSQFIPKVEVQIAAQVGGEVTDIDINGSYAYLAVGPRLVVMDLADPDILQVASMSDLLPGLGKALAIEGAHGNGQSGWT